MAFLRDVSDRFWNYVSPRKTVQNRDKPFKAPTLTVRLKTPKHKGNAATTSREMSPDSRVKSWHTHTPSSHSDIDMDATLLPPSTPGSAQPLGDDLEGDTLLPESPTSPTSDKTGSSADEVDANEDTMVVDDGTYMDKTVDIGAERKRREKQGRELIEQGWPQDAVFLFQKLGLRGFEPLFPIDWISDFETLPEDLFTAKLDKAFIKPANGTDYHAQLALSNLFDLGSVARDAWHTRAPVRKPAYHIKRAVRKYTKWAMKDGKVEDHWAALPLFEVVTWDTKVHSSVGEQKMIQKLGQLHERWYEARQAQLSEGIDNVPEIPTLYGVSASHTVMAFVSYAPPTESKAPAALRLIAVFDFGKEGYDVWNSLAVSIFVVHCRNRMIELKETLPEASSSSEADPDA